MDTSPDSPALAPAHTDRHRRPVVLYVIKEFPQISQTYIKCEIEAVERDYDVVVLTRRAPDLTYDGHHPFHRVSSLEEALAIAREVQPDLLHTHYLNQVAFTGALAERTETPFTVRAHSFDVLALRHKTLRGRAKEWIRAKLARQVPLARSEEFLRGLAFLEHDLCLGVLTFPFARPWLLEAGAPADKIVPVFPAVDVERFLDRGPNGDAVMNTGVATPKKRMEDYIALSRRVPERTFRLYAMGYHIESLRAKCERMRGRIEFVPPVQPAAMPAEYKRHQWLVYTADFDLATVGWPMAVAEAQAAGVGVCMPRIREDLAEYVGDAGYLYDSLDEVVEILRSDVPADVRERGFEQARRSDVRGHLHLLTDLWERALAGERAS